MSRIHSQCTECRAEWFDAKHDECPTCGSDEILSHAVSSTPPQESADTLDTKNGVPFDASEQYLYEKKISELRAENARLREALEKIAGLNAPPAGKTYSQRIAEAALEPPASKQEGEK